MHVFLLIGGYGGIGEALCARLTSEGHRVLLCGRDAAKAEQCANRYGQVGFGFDAREEGAFTDVLMPLLEREGGQLQGVANLAGSVNLKPIERTSLSDFRSALATNVETAFLTVKYLAPYLAKQGGGSIVLMSSVAARFGLVNHESIAAAKGAVEGLMLSAACSYAPKGVRLNAVAPALVDTPLTAGLISSEEARKASAAMHPLGRIGQADDVASMISWLLNPAHSWVSGQVFGVDGGMSRLKSRR